MRIVFVGASGHGKVCAEIAELSGKYDEVLFLDDDTSITECGGHSVVGISADFNKYLADDAVFFVSIGNCAIRKRIQEEIEDVGGKVATLIHPESVISKDAEIEAGTVVMAGAVINAGTHIGRGVIVNTSSSIDHDCVIGNYIHVAVGAHICGTVKIGGDCWIGAGSLVSNNVNICGCSRIGAGAVVIKDIDEAGIYVGVPAVKRIFSYSRRNG